jgi:Ring finger domain
MFSCRAVMPLFLHSRAAAGAAAHTTRGCRSGLAAMGATAAAAMQPPGPDPAPSAAAAGRLQRKHPLAASALTSSRRAHRSAILQGRLTVEPAAACLCILRLLHSVVGIHYSPHASPQQVLGLTLVTCLPHRMQVSALPCFHTYHKDCLEPWLRQQGRSSTCPICKTPVFEQTS